MDLYYLTFKAESIGYHPEIILAGRRLNDSKGSNIVEQLVKSMLRRHIGVEDARVLVMGLSFKENCPDLRNTRFINIIAKLAEYSITVDVFDPWVDPAEAERLYGLTPVKEPAINVYDAIVLAVGHQQFVPLGAQNIQPFGRENHVLYDLKYMFKPELSDLGM